MTDFHVRLRPGRPAGVGPGRQPGADRLHQVVNGGGHTRTMTNGAPHFQDTDVEVTKVSVGPMDNNVYVVRCRETGEALLIDAANEAERLLEMARRLGVVQVLETHGHSDHIQAVPAMREAGYEVGVHPDDAAMLPDYDFLIEDGTVFEIGRVRLQTMHTPGHTPGSLSFGIEGAPVLFSGDTLFPGGPGATRFSYSSFPTIIQSIEEKLFTLPPETIVMPGHGRDTTIATERPHLQEWIDRGW
jgi:glyoxylase-like metal-dependent hydrolase (beta-lactamase superfamily II)